MGNNKKKTKGRKRTEERRRQQKLAMVKLKEGAKILNAKQPDKETKLAHAMQIINDQ